MSTDSERDRRSIGALDASQCHSPVSRLIRASADALGPSTTSSDQLGRGSARTATQPNLEDNRNLPGPTDSEVDDRRLLTSAATEIYAMRRARDRYMPNGLASEPAWDILLALYSEQPNKLPVSSLCYGSGAPMTTALRWIGTLDSEGLVERSKHHRDGRIVLLSLTEKGCSVIERCLKAMLAVTHK